MPCSAPRGVGNRLTPGAQNNYPRMDGKDGWIKSITPRSGASAINNKDAITIFILPSLLLDLLDLEGRPF